MLNMLTSSGSISNHCNGRILKWKQRANRTKSRKSIVDSSSINKNSATAIMSSRELRGPYSDGVSEKQKGELMINMNEKRRMIIGASSSSSSGNSNDDNDDSSNNNSTEENGDDRQSFLKISVAFYVLMFLGSAVGMDYANVHPSMIEQVQILNLDIGTIWSLPLLVSLAFVLVIDERLEFVREVKEMFTESVIPQVASGGANGILLLSLGAGIGEEALFRGFLMPLISNSAIQNGFVNEDLAANVSLCTTSIIFGLLHAITPAYQIWATIAGFLFGYEYMNDGLGTAMFTHAFYDFIAFAFIILLWGKRKEEKTQQEII